MKAHLVSVLAVAIGMVGIAAEPALAVEDLSRGHNILLQQGLQIQASCIDTMVDFDLPNWAASNFTSAFFWHTYPMTLMPAPPGLPWGMSNFVANDVSPVFQPYAPRLINYQMGDEGAQGDDLANADDRASLKTAMEEFHVNWPNVITFTNQYGNQYSTETMQTYMREVEPDMLSFDTYPFDGNLAGGSSPGFYIHMQRYRSLGLQGNDGTGTRPIPVGLYTQTFNMVGIPGYPDHVVSGSEVRLNNFAAWAFGCKLANAFVYTGNNRGTLFDGNNTTQPTDQFYQVAETNRQSLNLGPALVRLVSTDVRMIMGEHGSPSEPTPNVRPFNVAPWGSTADDPIKSITATNLGIKNSGLPGDVIVGYFKPLDASFTNTGHEDDTYFMIVNGLSDATGLAGECRQMIQMTFDFGDSDIDSLLRISRDTGLIEEVSLMNGTDIFVSRYDELI